MALRNERSASQVKAAAPRAAVRKAEQATSKASAKAVAASPSNPMRPAGGKRRLDEQDIQRLVSERAFILFERRGFEHGHHEADWIEAEAQIRRELQQS